MTAAPENPARRRARLVEPAQIGKRLRGIEPRGLHYGRLLAWLRSEAPHGLLQAVQGLGGAMQLEQHHTIFGQRLKRDDVLGSEAGVQRLLRRLDFPLRFNCMQSARSLDGRLLAK